MKNFFLFSFILISSSVFANNPLRPVGNYDYTGTIHLNKKRTAETVPHSTNDGLARMTELKKTGFNCVRKNQKVSICQKIETTFDSIPDAIQKAVDKYLANAEFFFPGDGEPIIVHDGADTEWMVYEDILIGKNKINAYKIVRKKDARWYISLPVSTEQGIGVLELHSLRKIALPLTLESKIEGQTIAHFLTADFEI